MAVTARVTGDPAEVLDRAGPFLATDPVAHNLILSLMHARVAHPEPGRYWVVERGGHVDGVVFQSPLHFTATLTPMTPDACGAAVDAIVRAGVELPGVNGSAAAAASFAGQWAERARCPVRPVQGQRIYELQGEPRAPEVAGRVRAADRAERDLLVEWSRAFHVEVGDAPADVEQAVDRRLASGQLWVWDEGGAAAALAGVSAPVAGVARIGPVFTPPSRRNRGYASALVGAVAGATVRQGARCILYTDLANPTSNAIYRAIGFRPVAEALRYEFAARRPRPAG